jgi:hypothetical protein
VLLHAAVVRRVRPWLPVGVGLGALLLLVVLAGDVLWRGYSAGDVPGGFVAGEDRDSTLGIGPSNALAALRLYVATLGFVRLLAPQTKGYAVMHFGYLYPIVACAGVIAGVGALRRGGARLAGPAAVLAALGVGAFLLVVLVRAPAPMDQRFMTWILPVLGVLALLRPRLRRRPTAILIVCLSFTAATLLHMVTTSSVGRVALAAGRFTLQRGHLPTLAELAAVNDWIAQDLRRRHDGFGEIDRVARPGDAVLYLGHAESPMYGAWGPRFARRVDGVSGPAEVEPRMLSGAYRFVVLDVDPGPPAEHWRLDPEIRRRMEAALERIPHRPLHTSAIRQVFELDPLSQSTESSAAE